MIIQATPKKHVSFYLFDLSNIRDQTPYSRRNSYPQPKLQLLQSPQTPNRDLFTQILLEQNKNVQKNYLCFDNDESQVNFIENSQLKKDEQENHQMEMEMMQQEQQSISFLSDKKKRRRKNSNQVKVLKQVFKSDPNWSKQKVIQMAQKTGLLESQVYKWWWDQKKKITSNIYIKYKGIRKQRYRVFDQSQSEQNQFEKTKTKALIRINFMKQTQKKIVKKKLQFQ